MFMDQEQMRLISTATAEQRAIWLGSPDANVRAVWARESPTVTDDEAIRGLADESEEVRLAWIGRQDLPLEVARQAMQDRSERVRRSCAYNHRLARNSDAFEQGLTDRSAHVRLAWAARGAVRPTPEQIERGLCDHNAHVRAAWVNRVDQRPSLETVERGVSDPSVAVRVAWAYRRDYTASQAILERCVSDPSRFVRRAWAARGREVLYPDFVAKLLADPDRLVVSTLLRVGNWHLSRKAAMTLMERGYHPRDFSTTRPEWWWVARDRLSPADIKSVVNWRDNPGLIGARMAVAPHHPTEKRTRSCVALGIGDPHPLVRFLWASRA